MNINDDFCVNQKLSEIIKTKFPNVFECVGSKKPFLSAVSIAKEAFSEMPTNDEAIERLRRSNDSFPYIVLDLIFDIVQDCYFTHNVCFLESYFQTIKDCGYGSFIKSFSDKLLNNNEYKPTQYEIAATALMVKVLDVGTVELEKPLPCSRKNSDIYGTFQVEPVRVEVKRVSIEWPPHHDAKETKIVESSSIEVGYAVSLNNFLRSGDGNAIKEKIEQFWTIVSNPDAKKDGQGNILFDEITYYKEGENEYACTPAELAPANKNALLNSITFYPDCHDCRIISGPVTTTATMARTVKEDLGIFTTRDMVENPSKKNMTGAIVFEPLPSPTYREVPISRKFFSEIQEKLQQLETGCINLVVIGNPAPELEDALTNALCGTLFISYGEGPAQCTLERYAAPFTPQLQDSIVEEFQKLSGVIGLRIASRYELLKLYNNPNATVPVPEKLKTKIEEEMKSLFRE